MTSPVASNPSIVHWDIEFDRPIVDSKITHPITGEIQQAGSKGLKDGPPSISFRLFNVNSNIQPMIINRTFNIPMEELYLAVAKQVYDGIYSLISINATGYSFIVVCEVKVSGDDFKIAWKNMFSQKGDYKYTDEEWDAYLEQKYGKFPVHLK